MTKISNDLTEPSWLTLPCTNLKTSKCHEKERTTTQINGMHAIQHVTEYTQKKNQQNPRLQSNEYYTQLAMCTIFFHCRRCV